MKQRLGQHFLVNKKVLQKIAAAVNIKSSDTVIEIGPGHGELTEILKMKNQKSKIIAIEKDGQLAKTLKEKYKNDKNIEIVEGDALKIIPTLIQHSSFGIHHYSLVGNLPYYITGKLLRIVSELRQKPKMCVFTIQREVAERIMATPPHMNILAAAVQIWAEPTIIGLISPHDFNPPPKVGSAVIKLTTRNLKLTTKEQEKYYNLIKLLFKQPRKTILNNFAEGVGLSKEKAAKILQKYAINPQDRPQNMTIEQILELSSLL